MQLTKTKEMVSATVGSASPYVVVWRLTEVCDLDCRFCNFRKSARFRRRSLTRDEVLRLSHVLGEWSRRRNGKILLSWLGGEPFTWTHLLDVSKELRSDVIATGATTNSRLLSSCRFNTKELIDSLDELTISIDGWREAHDSSRNVGGLYQQIMARCHAISLSRGESSSKFRLRANILFDRKSFSYFRHIVADCVASGVNEVTFNALWVGDGHDLASRRLTPGDLDQIAVELVKLRAEFGEVCQVRGSTRYVLRLRSYAECRPVPVRDCGPGLRTLFVDSTGLVAPCAYTANEYGVPSVALQIPEDVDRLIASFREQKSRKMAPFCFDCPDTNVFGKFEL